MASIAIVGRANVGKSTLFNRLTGRRGAIVHDLPGVTRDRRTGEARLGDLAFEAIDTAGLEESQSGSLAERMAAQAWAAVDEADAALLLIDARAGLTAADEVIAGQLRRSGKPLVLVANKAEGRAGEGTALEAWRLGLGESIALSAEHGEGLADLHRALAAVLDQVESVSTTSRPDERPIRVAIVGRPNAGKSTLANRLIGADRLLTGPEAGITRDAIEIDVVLDGRPIRLVDTAGLRRKAKVTDALERLAVKDALRAINFAEVVVLMMDAAHPFETQDLQIADLIAREGRAIVLALAKWDLIQDRGERLKALRQEAQERLPQLRGAAVVALSAETGEGMASLAPAIAGAHAEWSARLKTADLNAWLRLAAERNPPPAVRGRRARLKYIAQTKNKPPTFVLIASRSAALDDAYRRYLVNSLRQSFDLPGAPIRLIVRGAANPYAPSRRRPQARRSGQSA